MNDYQTHESSRWLGDIRSEMSPSQLVVAQTVIGFDRNSQRCRGVAGELEAIALSIDRKLAEATTPVEIETGRIVAFTPETSGLEAWQKLAETMLVFVPKGPSPAHCPALTLALPSDILHDNESRAILLQQLAQLDESYSSIVCVFVEGDAGEQLQQAWEEASWQSWLSEVTEALPGSVVRFYLVGRTASDGRLLTVEDQTTVAAHAIFADVVLRNRNAPRYLAQSLTQPEASIGVLGMSGQLVSAEAAAHCLAPRLCCELIEELQSCQPVGLDLQQGVPTDPFQLLVRASQNPMPFDATAALERAESREQCDYEVPSLVGYDSRFTVNIGKATKSLRLDGIPANLWRSRLSELDALISSERADAIAVRACEYLDQFTIRDERRIHGVLRQAFALRLCDEPVRAAADRFVDHINKHRNTIVVSCDQEDIDGSLDRMDAKVQQLNCWRSGLVTTVLALLLALAVIWACNSWATGAIRVWGTILPAAAAVAIGLGAAGRWCWARHLAVKARDDVLEQIQRRAQHAICQCLHQKLEETATRLHDSIQSSATALCDATRVVTQTSERSSIASETQEPLINRPRSHSREMESIYRFTTHRPTEYGALVDKFQDRCSDLAEELLRGSVAPAHALASLHAFLHNELMLLLSSRMDIWRIYCRDHTASLFDDATFFGRVQQWSVPVFCGTGSVFADREGSGYSATTFWICPDALASRVACHADMALLPMDDRVLALHRMTLTPVRSVTADPRHKPDSEKAQVAHATKT